MKPVSGKRTLALSAVQESSSDGVYRRGVQYYRRKKVLKYQESDSGEAITALVIGSEPQPYKVEAAIENPKRFKAECSCPYFEDVCKHSVAVLLTYIAKRQPGIRFDLDNDRGRGGHDQKVPRAKDYLEAVSDSSVQADQTDVTLGLLILEKPLALIVGTIPENPQGKVNILKVPPEVLGTLEKGSRIWKMVRYLTDLPHTTKGMAGGHRIPRGDEGIVLGHLSLCAGLKNTTDENQEMGFSAKPVKPVVVLKETENGELLIRLKAVTEDGAVLANPVYFLGSSSWVLSENVFYRIDVSPLHRLFQFFDSYGEMKVRLEIVPKFLAVDLPILKKRMSVELDETLAPFPVAITEPPRVVIRVKEKDGGVQIALGFGYGDLVLPSKDETSAVESELYTRTISETGQSVWVKRLWEQEGQVRKFFTNLQPTRLIADRFFFTEEAALETVFYLSSEQCCDWEIAGLEKLDKFRVLTDELMLNAFLSLKKDSFKFEFEIDATAGEEKVAFGDIVANIFQNKNYLESASGNHVRLPVQNLISLLKAIHANKGPSGAQVVRPLYQALPIAQALEAHGVEIEADEGFEEFLERLGSFKKLEPVEVDETFVGELREYQKEGFNWLSFLREYGLSGILADDMGLGKTIQTLVLLLKHHKGKKRNPSLVVAPTSVVYNWMTEARKFTPKLTTELFLGRDRASVLAKMKSTRKNAKKPDVVFTTYGIIRRDYETLKEIQFDYVILDEAQNIKNPESVGAIASKSLKALHRLALTGTPVENRLRELWSIFDFLMPEFLGDYKEFYDTFERPIEVGIDGAGQKLRKIVHPFLLRRLKTQVEKELPERTDIVNMCDLEDDQRSLYLDVLDECRQKVFGEIAQKGIKRSQISVLAALLRLRQVCCDPRLLKNRGDEAPPSSAKLEALMDMIEEVVDEGHRILVFSQFVEMLTLVRKEFEKKGLVYEYLDGQTPAKERLNRVNRFNGDESIPVFLISLKAGGTGLNLTGADYVIHYDPWWNPAVENQATDRAHRIGQTRHVFNYKLITKGTVEEKILALQEKKKELAELVVGGDEGVAKELTREDLEFLFSF